MYRLKGPPVDAGAGVLKLTASSSVCEQCFFEQPVVASVNVLPCMVWALATSNPKTATNVACFGDTALKPRCVEVSIEVSIKLSLAFLKIPTPLEDCTPAG
ncbi:MAG TPA: hypothetical protein VMR62_24570 [Bryobacteraceae bacterium]|nr:hypothetical protein [Bryobacteraceae bacterium]